VTGTAPILPGGWRLLGVIDHTMRHPDLGYLVRSIDEASIPDEYRTRLPACDHCQTIRNRKRTFIVQSEDGETRQVGGQCLKDYLGRINPESLARYYYDLISLSTGEADIDFGLDQATALVLEGYLARVASVIRTDGWVSRRAASERFVCSTATAALPPAMGDDDLEITVDDRKAAREALEWARTDLPEIAAGDDYLTNLAIVCSQSFISYREVGIAASLIPTWRRHTGADVLGNGQKAEAARSEFQGEIGERITRELMVKRRLAFSSDYRPGPFYIHILNDLDGNIYVWRTHKELLEGHLYEVTGTVKAHEYYRAIRQTVLTRCRVTEILIEKGA